MTKLQHLCTGCGQPLGEARLIVHDPHGVTGQFHLDGQCYAAARARAVPLEARLRHADVESVLGIEHRMLELVSP